MFALLLLNKLGPRRRVVSGVACVVTGLVSVAAAALLAPGLIVHGAVLAATGGVLWVSGAVARRRASRAADVPVTSAELSGRR